MSDLRNFYGSDNSDIKIVEPVEHVEPVYSRFIPEAELGDHVEPLGAFHTTEVEETSNTGRILGGLAIALMVGAAAVYGYQVSNGSQTAKPVVTQTAANNPAPASVVTAPPDQSAAASQTAPVAPAAPQTLTAPTASSPATPVDQPVKKAPVRSSRSVARSDSPSPSSSSAGVPEQSAAVQPVYPTAPATSLANNNPSIVEPDMPLDSPAVPNTTPVQPAPDAAPVQPAPEQAIQPVPAPDQTAQPAQ